MKEQEQIAHEIDMDTQTIEVARKRRRVNLQTLDSLNKRETENYMKQFKKGESYD